MLADVFEQRLDPQRVGAPLLLDRPGGSVQAPPRCDCGEGRPGVALVAPKMTEPTRRCYRAQQTTAAAPVPRWGP